MRLFSSKLLLNTRPKVWKKPQKIFDIDQLKDVIYDGYQFVVLGQNRSATKILGYISTSSDGKNYTTPTKYSELDGATYPMPDKSYGWQGIAKTNNRYGVISVPRRYEQEGCITNFTTTNSLSSWFTSSYDDDLRKKYISICANTSIHATLAEDGYYALTGHGEDPDLEFERIGRVGGLNGLNKGSVINYINNKFVVVGKISISPAYGTESIAFATNISDTIRNANSWTIIQPNNASELYDYDWVSIDYLDNEYILISKNGYITKSTDLTNWETPKQPHNLVLNNDEWVAFAHSGSIAVLLSENGYITTKDI